MGDDLASLSDFGADNTTDVDGSRKSESESQSGHSGAVRTVPPEADAGKIGTDVAAQIGTRELWIANGGAIDPSCLTQLNINPEWVVSVSSHGSAATTDHHPLRDGYINEQADFEAAVEAARERIRADGTAIVNCAAGVSRSSTVIATAVAAEEDRLFNDVVDEIQQTRERAHPHSKLRLSAYVYLAGLAEDRPDELRLEDYDMIDETATSINERHEDGRVAAVEEHERLETALKKIAEIHPDNVDADTSCENG